MRRIKREERGEMRRIRERKREKGGIRDSPSRSQGKRRTGLRARSESLGAHKCGLVRHGQKGCVYSQLPKHTLRKRVALVLSLFGGGLKAETVGEKCG